jgi:hypothetical protein
VLQPRFFFWPESRTTSSINPELQVPFQRLLTEFVRLTREGKFNLAWEFHCTHCNGIPGFSHRFGELKSENYCAACDLGFRNTLDKNIEVTFTAHPSFRAIPPQVKESFQQQILEAVKAKRFQMPAEYVSGLECLNNETLRYSRLPRISLFHCSA